MAASEAVRGVVVRKQKSIEQSEKPRGAHRRHVFPRKLLQVPEDIQCTTVGEPSGFKD